MKNILPTGLLLLSTGASHIRLPSDPVTVSDFVQEIKHEVSEFERRKAETPPVTGKCAVDFNLVVRKLVVSMDVVLKRTSGATAGAEIPLGSGTLGASFGTSSAIAGSQNITFAVFPAERGITNPAPKSRKFEGTPIADALTTTYGALVTNSQYEPCVTFGGDKEQEANKVKFGVKIERSTKAGATVKIVVFSLGATTQEDLSRENSMTAFFTLQGQAIQ